MIILARGLARLPLRSSSTWSSISASRPRFVHLHHSTTPTRSSRHLTVALGTASLVASIMIITYTKPFAALRFDALDSDDAKATAASLKTSNNYESLALKTCSSSDSPAIKLCKITTPAELQKDAHVDEIPHRHGNNLTWNTLESINPDTMTKILRKHEQAVVVGHASGVLRYDTNEIASNCPIEDDHSEAIMSRPSASTSPSSKGYWMFWGIYDGHAGWSTSAKLRMSLIHHVYRKLEKLYLTSDPSDEQIDRAIKAGFLNLDKEIVINGAERATKAGSKDKGAMLLAPAISGSCALLTFYDTRTQQLRVACTGDSRAVLGTRVNGTTWSAKQLSSDQTGENPDEAAKVRAEHPGEKDVVQNGRVLGYEPSRAFGDASQKWSRRLSLALRKACYAKSPQDKILTPPYMTAEPVITKVQPKDGDFLVIASDSLWEMLSNEEVVGLVGRWIDQGKLGIPQQSQRQSSVWGKLPALLLNSSSGGGLASNVQPSEPSPGEKKPFGRPPVRPGQWGLTTRERVPVVQDLNVASHLARNALGGDDHSHIASLFLLGGSNTRRFRDDLTITVVFFGQE